MPKFSYSCPNHGSFSKFLEKRAKTFPCPICQTESQPIIKAGSVSIMERKDNGAMGRAVEVLHNIEEIMEDRSKKYLGDEDV